ncbi:hypothetical protein PGTUg99_028888 [Puccinia graminis f. sp. tritici]|uniref:Uncharacterized protein n=1 Tax=Puccinia graminis f. sp. tritici TaxID=56615 RepID=A0A5B0RBB4_PUCGR|nr:hypothetical protein PGTUg99_028888 [Puccinia graminis f. sp. tritici]
MSVRTTGSFMSSRLVKRDFFGPDAKHACNLKLTTIERPMLYNIIHGIISRAEEDGDNNEIRNAPDDLGGNDTDDINDIRDAPDDLGGITDDPLISGTSQTGFADGVAETEPEVALGSCSGSLEDVMADYGGFVYSTYGNGQDAKNKQRKHIASVICSMLSFACNCRHNGLQLENSIRFYACGVSETVNEYLHYLGLTLHRKTAVHALRSLAREAQDKIASCMAISTDVAPILCIDNLDMEERIQIATVGKQNRMFHGTWGYIHVPSSDLMNSLNPDNLTLSAYHNSLKNVSSLVINPKFFLPNDGDQEH